MEKKRIDRLLAALSALALAAAAGLCLLLRLPQADSTAGCTALHFRGGEHRPVHAVALHDGIAAACALVGTRDIILAHLSEENNTPQMARSAVGRALEAVGYQGRLSVAPRREMGEVHVLEVAECSVSR